MNELIPDDQEAFEYQVQQSQWWEEFDAAVKAQEEYVLENMRCEDYLEAVECMSKFRHQELWNAMREEDIQEMREVMRAVFKDYASMKAHQNVDGRIR